MMTFEQIRSLSDEEISARIRELSDILDFGPSGDKWDAAYNEYSRLRAVEDERYRERNQDAFDAFYKTHIKGKKWEEIDPEALECYSDWHKEMYGFRPRHI